MAYKDFLAASEIPVKWAFLESVRYSLALSERASNFNHLSSPHRSNRKIKTVFKTVKFKMRLGQPPLALVAAQEQTKLEPITVWLEVRILPGPPCSPAIAEIS